MQHSNEIPSREPPFERLGDGFVMSLESQQAFCELLQGREIVWREDLSLEDREINLDLIEPTGMDGPLNEHQVGVFVLESLDCPGTSMRRTVVDDPENTSCPAIGMLFHDLIDEAVKGRDSGFGFAATEEFGPVDIQGSQIGPGS